MTRRIIDVRSATPDQIRWAGIEVLTRELGIAGMLRFMQQYEPGQGDYIEERRALLGSPTVDELFDEMKAVCNKQRASAARPQSKRRRGPGR